MHACNRLSAMIDMRDMFYPDTSEDEASVGLSLPPADFITSWCRNGHGLRIEPGAKVMYLQTYTQSDLLKEKRIIRNGHGHPLMLKGVVSAIDHANKNVTILVSADSITMGWDLVVAREDSSHASLPVALLGTNFPKNTFSDENTYCYLRQTLEFKCLQAEMPDRKRKFVEQLLDDAHCVAESAKKGTLRSIAFNTLMDCINQEVADAKIGFAHAAFNMINN